MSALLLVTSFIFAGGLAFLAGSADRPGAKPGLLVIAGAVGVVALVGVRMIHRARILTPWLLLGLIPAAVGGWWLYLR
jgi:NADH:ubiquinone oxidoreductase subunit 6 (subunit J)